MIIKILDSFSVKLVNQVEYIALDKPSAARKFKIDIIFQIKDLNKMPFKHRQSIYFQDENIRDLIFKGYTIVYRVKLNQKIIEVFGFIKHEESL